MKSKVFRVSFPAEMGQLPSALEWLRKHLEAEKIDSSEVRCWELVLEELMVNIIKHGYRTRPGKVDLELGFVLGSEVSLTITDQAPAFNPLLDAPRPDVSSSLEERKVGGLGLYLVRKSVDELFYDRREGKNILRLIKHSSQTK
jgi:serine/threonine-protein kinase RsbW